MRITLALAALTLAFAPAASAEPVERCEFGYAGRVITVEDQTLSVCVAAGLCPGYLGVYAVVNGHVLLNTCTPAHIDRFWMPECDVLMLFAPGIPGVVDIDWDGDLAVDGYPVWECPPFWD